MRNLAAVLGSSGGSIDEAIARTDYVRRSPAHFGGPAGHKEWLHFCILAPGLDLLINFSFCDDVRPDVERHTEVARLIVLVRQGGWDGDIDAFADDEVRAAPAGIDVVCGENVLQFRDGAYRVRIRLRERPIAADLVLRPLTMPGRAPNIPLRDGPPLHWVVTPRCTAEGTVTVGRREMRLSGAMAYHDHNFGLFRWGQDFSWRWAFALPVDYDEPWSFAFASLAERTRNHVLSQGAFVWRGAHRQRTFRDHDVVMSQSPGFLALQRVFKIPRVMALVSPDVPTDVPSHVDFHAEVEGDWVDYHFEPESLGQVLIPNERDLGFTALNEATGRSHIHGKIRGERFSSECRSVFEFLGP
jgi:hypothetical protein